MERRRPAVLPAEAGGRGDVFEPDPERERCTQAPRVRLILALRVGLAHGDYHHMQATSTAPLVAAQCTHQCRGARVCAAARASTDTCCVENVDANVNGAHAALASDHVPAGVDLAHNIGPSDDARKPAGQPRGSPSPSVTVSSYSAPAPTSDTPSTPALPALTQKSLARSPVIGSVNVTANLMTLLDVMAFWPDASAMVGSGVA